MNLESTLLVTFVGGILGWLLKVFTDTVSTRYAEKKVINLLIYRLYRLMAHLDLMKINIQLYNGLGGGEDARIFWQSTFGKMRPLELMDSINSATTSLAELNPLLSQKIASHVSAIQRVMELANLDYDNIQLQEESRKIYALIEHTRGLLSIFTNDLASFRRLFRRSASKKALLEAAKSDNTVEEVIKNSFKKSRSKRHKRKIK